VKDTNLFWLRPGELVAWRGHSVLIVDDKGALASGLHGLYFKRTRFLSRCVFTVDGKGPEFVSASTARPHAIISYHLAPSPEGNAAGPPNEKQGGEIAEKAIEIQVNRYVGNGLHQDVHVSNHGLAEATVTVGIELDADFADQREATQGKRQQSAPVERSWKAGEDGAELTFTYTHPKLPHASAIRFYGAGKFAAHRGRVSCTLTLRNQESRCFCLDVCPVFLGEAKLPFYGIDGVPKGEGETAERLLRDWDTGCARLATPNALVQKAWDRAVADLGSLQLLQGEGAERFTLAAGMPKYSGLFGRDTLIAAWQSALLNPATLRGTLSLIGKYQAAERDDKIDAEPGKMLHQHEEGPLEILGKTPFLRYYGDYSTTGLFLLGLATEYAWTADAAFLRSQFGRARAVLAWMERDGDRDHDGFYEYQTRSDQGVKNQGWKDSEQAILYEDGDLVRDPIATCELQGLYYAAKQSFGLALIHAGERDWGAELLRQAAELKRRFNETFWLPDARYIALALDPDKRPVRSFASNPGECLAWGIVDDDKAAAVVERLMAPDLFSGWGIRSLSSRHPAYNPLAYHLGTVWPFASAFAAFGMRRYGYVGAMHTLAKALFEASDLFRLDRLPEVIGGHARDERHPHPGVYPGASAPQAWSASAVVLLVQAMLGIVPLAPLDTLIVDPVLPTWLREVTLENIQVGSSRVSLRFRRDGAGETRHEILTMHGELRVLRPKRGEECGPDAQDRIAAAIRCAL
jgi:glycogen debranching enzyme